MRRTIIGHLSHGAVNSRSKGSKADTITKKDNSKTPSPFHNLLTRIKEFAMNPRLQRKKVVIIGAGASGIAAATRLYESGIKDIIVLEAENCIGGRVNTIYIENGVLELGAQWIHGKEDNVVYELASDRNATCNSTAFFDAKLENDNVVDGRNLICDMTAFEYMICARSSGEILDQKMANRLLEIYQKLHEKYSEGDFESFKSSGEFYIHILKTELEKDENADIPEDVRSEFIELCHQLINSYEASDSWFDTSTSTFTEYKTCEGNLTIMWNGIGFRTLFSILMEKSQALSKCSFESDVISLNMTVEKISLQNDGSTVIVKCTNGKKIHANHVIISVSLGVLQEMHTKLFENIQIPELKIRSINNLSFGTVDKIYLEFSKPWWPTNKQGFNFLWTESDREEYTKRGLEWVTALFAVITVDFAPKVLCGWITGAAARTMESLDEKFVLETVMEVLRKFLSKKWDIPDPVRIIRSTWYSNKHFRGSYSFRSLKTEAADVSASTLSIPITDNKGTPILLFAGEATSRHYYSTVHGAVESGWREADRLIPFIKKA